MKSRIAVLAGLVGLAMAAPASATPKSFYFDCTGTAPLQTIDVDTYSWSETMPASVQEGAGCGWLDPPLVGTNQPNPLYDAAFGGAYKGEVRKLEFTLYAPNTPATNKTIDLILRADGEDQATLDGLVPTVGPGPNDAIAAFTYTVTGLDLPALKAERDYILAVSGHYTDDTPGWLQGAKEVPSGVKFYAFNDLTPEEQQEILCSEDPSLCPVEEE